MRLFVFTFERRTIPSANIRTRRVYGCCAQHGATLLDAASKLYRAFPDARQVRAREDRP